MEKTIKEYFSQLPSALKEQILLRASMGMVSGILTLGIILYTKAWILALPGLILAFFLIVNSLHLLYNCGKGRYVAVTGRCVDMEVAGIKKRVRSIRMITGGKMLRIFLQYRWKTPMAEEVITVYLPKDAPVYEVDGEFQVYRFYALEISRKV